MYASSAVNVHTHTHTHTHIPSESVNPDTVYLTNPPSDALLSVRELAPL